MPTCNPCTRVATMKAFINYIQAEAKDTLTSPRRLAFSLAICTVLSLFYSSILRGREFAAAVDEALICTLAVNMFNVLLAVWNRPFFQTRTPATSVAPLDQRRLAAATQLVEEI